MSVLVVNYILTIDFFEGILLHKYQKKLNN